MTATIDIARRAIDAYAIARDETEFYNIDPADAPLIERIMGVYVFDRNERVHCGELTASYYLIHCYAAIHFTDAASDHDRERLDEKYGYAEGDSIYIHCRDIEKVIKAGQRDRINHYGDVAPNHLEDGIEDADEQRSREIESIREDLCANRPF